MEVNTFMKVSIYFHGVNEKILKNWYPLRQRLPEVILIFSTFVSFAFP